MINTREEWEGNDPRFCIEDLQPRQTSEEEEEAIPLLSLRETSLPATRNATSVLSLFPPQDEALELCVNYEVLS